MDFWVIKQSVGSHRVPRVRIDKKVNGSFTFLHIIDHLYPSHVLVHYFTARPVLQTVCDQCSTHTTHRGLEKCRVAWAEPECDGPCLQASARRVRPPMAPPTAAVVEILCSLYSCTPRTFNIVREKTITERRHRKDD